MVACVFLARGINVLLIPLVQLHPIVKGVFTLVNAVFQVIKAQADLDENVKKLIAEMDDACELAKEHAPLEGVPNSTNPIIRQMLAGVERGAEVIKSYCEQRASSVSLQHSDYASG